MRTWHEGYPIPEENDAEHKERGSAGGGDYPLPVGTPLYAPATGWLRARYGGTGGWTLSLNPDELDDVEAIECMHVSDTGGLELGGGSVHVNEGDYAGLSGGRKGAPGAGNSGGPHAHEHVDLAGGGRTGIYEYMLAHPELEASAGELPKPPKKGQPTMRVLKNTNTGRTYGVTAGVIKHHANEAELAVALKAEGQDAPVEFDNNEFALVLFDYGLENAVQINGKGEATIDYFNASPAGHTTVAPWLLR